MEAEARPQGLSSQGAGGDQERSSEVEGNLNPGLSPGDHEPTLPSPGAKEDHEPMLPSPGAQEGHEPTLPSPGAKEDHEPTLPSPGAQEDHEPTLPSPQAREDVEITMSSVGADEEQEPRPKPHRHDQGPSDQSFSPVQPTALGKKLPETIADRISKAQELKREGNSFFRTGKWNKAVGKYHRALLYVKGIADRFEGVPAGLPMKDVVKVKATSEEEAAAKELLITVSNNLAVCQMKMTEWERTLIHTKKVLQLQPENAKALFRSGVAKLNLNRLEGAEEDLKKAETLDPEDTGIKKQLQLLQQKQKQYERTEQQMYSAMFKR